MCVSVIIPVYNDATKLRRCLSCLNRQAGYRGSYEVIVVDNNSSEDIGSVVQEFERVRCIVESGVGPAAARNAGARAAKGSVLAFTDSDCLPERTWLRSGVSAILGTDRPGMVGGKIALVSRRPHTLNVYELYDSTFFFSQADYIAKHHTCAAANMFVRRDVFWFVGGFDAVTFTVAGGEDWDFGKRVWEAGFVQRFSAECVVHHPSRSSFGAVLRKELRIEEGNRAFAKRRLARVPRTRVFPPICYYLRRARDAGLKGTDKASTLILAVVMYYVVSALYLLKQVVCKWHPRTCGSRSA